MTSLNSFAQSQTNQVFEEWANNRGVQEFFYKNVTVIDSSRNIYVAGATLNAQGDYDLLLTKYDRRGQELWSDIIAGPGGGHDFATDIALDSQQNVIVCGSISEIGAEGNNMLVVKYDPDGFEYWRRSYDHDDSNEAGAAICIDAANNIYCTGATQDASGFADMLTIKIDSTSQIVWAETYDYNNLHDLGVKIGLSGARVIVTGVGQFNAATWQAMSLSYQQTNGNLTGTSNSGSASPGIEEVADLFIDDQENIYVAGSKVGGITGYDMLLIKLDEDLNIEWTREWDGNGMTDKGSGVRVAPNGDVYLSGTTQTAAQGTDVVLVKYNQNGDLIWSQTYNGEYNGDDESASLEWHPEGFLYVAGSSFVVSNLDYLTLKYDTTGALLWSKTFNSPFNKDDRGTNLAIDTQGDIIVTGQCETDSDGRTSYYAVKYVERKVTDTGNQVSITSSKYFTPNVGQIRRTDSTFAEEVVFISRNDYPGVFVQNNKLSYVFSSTDTTSVDSLRTDTLYRIDMVLNKKNRDQKMYPLESLEYFENYYLGYMAQMRERIHPSQRLVSFDVWKHTDLILSNQNSGLVKYIVGKPGFNGNDISWTYEGVDTVLLQNNELHVYTPLGVIQFDQPNVWQLDAIGNQVALTWQPEYNVTNNKVSFILENFNESYPLIIEIEKVQSVSSVVNGSLDWSTYFGTPTDVFTDIASGDGDIWITGYTMSPDFPIVNGYQETIAGNYDVVVANFEEGGELNWSTFYGGSNDDALWSIESSISVGPTASYAIIHGRTASSDLPMVELPGAYFDNINDCQLTWQGDVCFDSYIARFNDLGILEWSTYFGGYGGLGFATASNIDQNGNFYIAGGDANIDYVNPGGGAYFQSSGLGHLAKFDQSGELVWSTNFGGANANGLIRVRNISFDSESNIYFSGITGASIGFPLQQSTNSFFQGEFGGGNFDGFVSKFNSNNLELEWSTYFGGEGDEQLYGAAHSPFTDEYIIAGSTDSDEGFPFINSTLHEFFSDDLSGIGTYNNAIFNGDCFIAKFSAEENELTHSTLFGGTANDGVMDVVIRNQIIYLLIITSSSDLSHAVPNLPIGFVEETHSDGNDAGDDIFLLAMDHNFDLIWTTYFGGTNSISSGLDHGYGMSVSASNKLFITGATLSQIGFPLQDPGNAYFQNFPIGGFVSKFDVSNLIVTSLNENENTEDAGLFVYPNPTSDMLLIMSEDITISQIQLFDPIGKLIFMTEVSLRANMVEIDMSPYPTGMYVLSVIDVNREKQTVRIIKK